MKRVRDVAPLRRTVERWKRARQSIAFVPTMGAIHEGHEALMKRARASSKRLVVSVFVNPLQFGAGEDYRRYPRPVRRDRARIRAAGADLLWEPEVSDLYDASDHTRVRVDKLDQVLEGAVRPGHFEGVATVVNKLLNAVMPDVLWLGQKDAQQARLIEQMVIDLKLPVRVRRGPTVRESDGLACSSRNAYMSRPQRAQAVALYQGLELARRSLRDGERSARRLIGGIRGLWREFPRVREDYIAVVDAQSLEPVRTVKHRVLIAVAARVGRTRLIDNFEWEPR